MPHASDELPSLLGPGPEAAVVIPVRNAERTLSQCLEAIFASEGFGKFDVIVVDDGSTDSSAEIASRFSCQVISGEHSRGPAAARNRGATEAKTALVFFVDADVFVKPDTLALLLAALNTSAAAFASYDPNPFNQNFATVLYHTLACRSQDDTVETTPAFYSYCAGIRRNLFVELGGFDTTFTRATFEDMELGWRLAGQGLLSRHLHNAKVVHAVQYDLVGLARAYFRKSEDLAWLLLSRSAITLGDQGWTHRKNWAVLVCAWGVIGLAPLALWVNRLWVLPWTLAIGGFLSGSGQLCWSMARRHWHWGPLSVLSFLGINLIATAAMLTAVARFARSCVSRNPRHGGSSTELLPEAYNHVDQITFPGRRP